MRSHHFSGGARAGEHGASQTAAVHLGIVCPMANERETAVRFVTSLLRQCDLYGIAPVTLFVVIDRKSTDGTRDLLESVREREPRLRIVWAPENRCVVDAYVRGYREAIAAGCDWILEIDAGYSHQPEDLPAFLEKISRGGTWLANLLLGTRLQDMTSGYELFSRPVLQQVLARGVQSRGHFFQTEIKTYCRKFRVAEVPIHYRAASAGVNLKVLKDAFANLWRLFRLRLSGRL
jgi:dolichol-phosphate mannosyltransferase